jgi:ribose transport system permease protein
MSIADHTPRSPRPPALRLLQRLAAVPFVYPLFALLLLLVWIERPVMLKPMFFFTILRQAVPLILVAVGQSLCMRVRSIDLSATGVIVGAVYILTGGWIAAPTWVLCALALGLGLGVGAVNAWFIAIRRASAVLVTLATAMITSGVVLILSGLRQPDRAPEDLVAFGRARLEGVPLIALATIALVLLCALALRVSVLRRVMDAIGTNPKAAWTSGLPYVRTIFTVHMLSGGFAALAAVALIATLGKGSVTLGADLALFSLAAVVLGGVSFGIARGGVLGPALAAAMLTLLFNFLTAYDVTQPARQIVVGLVIIAAAIVISLRETGGPG